MAMIPSFFDNRLGISIFKVLQISGERTVEKEDRNDTWHRMERSSGKFSRRFGLPGNAKMDQIKACMENGVLTVTVPKEVVKKPEAKAAEISERQI
ncbi:HEAT-SHOCK PROTEIN 20 FAMILY MEMBER [Salix viminalis]|uniref:HEAT-SHOCK PROTEIN 20 FAMILY MEMBER n=1 Tax=Salix viminalis TaxID=40686 RepID=A0A9Q0NKU8_SALVM|nr:HEAT-SHOCK PROTEIN 20 FAMILY MEMBER [Salix viminalis]